MSKTVFITGTSTGFGKLATITLSKAGHTVIAAMRGVTGKNAAVAKELSALPNVDVVEMEVTSDSSVQEAVQQSLRKHGKIDVLVNNAAMAGYGPLEAYSLDQVRSMLDVNLFGVLRTYQAVLPSMRANGNGLIINITTGASGFTLPFMVPYLISKFGVETITEGGHGELQRFGIETVSIQPGVYPTEMNTGVKTGIHADRQDIFAAYGEETAQAMQSVGATFGQRMAEFKPDPQMIADGILALVNMAKGTRPLRYPLDIIAEGTDKDFIDARAALKEKWLAKYFKLA
ncbi:SDR family NAD(P)-dependent oxidoreductase [Chitinophaga agrisoli]|uniref:SDR family NAD(P)-dependent oxidoreductase n=1 Tax=Chitinophaga agrisoli TaxID=2607653 RepID=A0A5B2VXU7_9BACT|nr:SDR family NAD(P)-dependent oxidoreductase [Chitinophaga agrisoli]KAA2243644.1 SDR family NAD(P)-dependent oxidoreductase [Chitinophaga agrisoli]